MSKIAELANRDRLAKVPVTAKEGSTGARVFHILVLLGTVLLLSLCMTGSAMNYYSGQQYTFSTPYSANWEYSWYASCCSDSTQPCCYDPAKTNGNTFVLTAPIVDKPTEITISLVVRDKALPTCMEMAELKIIAKPLAGISVVKKHLGGEGIFPFESTGFAPGVGITSFSLGPSNDYTFAWPSLDAGTYSITELVPDDWNLDTISVTGTDAANYKITGCSITIMYQPGESIVVTFTNEKSGSIMVDKVTSPSGSMQKFEFKPSYGDSFRLSDTSEPNDSGPLAPDIYSITETATTGWDLADISVTDIASTPIIDRSSGTISFDLAAGETALVTYANRVHQSDISGIAWDDVNKNGVIDEGEQRLSSWTVKLLDSSGNVVATDITDENGYYEFNDIAPGIYTIVTTPQADWIPTYPSSGKAEIVFTDFPVVQNFGYQKLGSIIVIKDAIPDSGQSFTFTGTLGKFTLVDDGTSSNHVAFEKLEDGDYEIVEQIPSGWPLISVKCTGASSDYITNGIIVHLKGNSNAIVKFEDTATLGGLKLNKTALNTTAKIGEDILYTIKLCNDGPIPLTNVTLWDVLPDSVEPVYIYPETTSQYLWHIGTMAPRQCFAVDIRVRVKRTDINYDMSQEVRGEGFVNVHNDYDTHQGPESITNCAYAKADRTETVSSCAFSRIVDPGTELRRREFGSGTYESEELTRIHTENKSIKTVTSLSAVHKPTTFSLLQGRSIGYATKWTEKSKGINTITGASMNEEYTFANKIEKDRSIELDKNSSTMKTEVEFEGTGHIGVLKKEGLGTDLDLDTDSHPNDKPIYEGVEDYVGNFKVYEMVDEYGSSVQSNKSVSGYGYVALDKRVKDSQRTYESGTGSYESDEIMETPTNYIAKDINLVHGPTNYTYTPNFGVSQDMKWTEGTWSKSGVLLGGDLFKDSSSCGVPATIADNSSPPASYISERYSSLDYLKKESIASGLNEMNTNVSFSGVADYRIKSVGTNHTNKIDKEELYAGQYDITRRVLITGVSKYDRPHITVTKEGNFTTKWFNKTNAQVAEYVITVTNDGNRALAPIYVEDIFPPGTEYISSSIRPSSLSRTGANWTLVNIGIGNTIKIELVLNVTEYAPCNIVNRVKVCGAYNGSYVCAGNYSSVEFDGMTCCPIKVLVSKRAWLDAVDPTNVHYSIVVANNAPDNIAVTVTDQLPGGMTLLNASINPNTDAAGHMVWVLPEIMPGGTKVIDYMTKALRDGGYSSTVHIDATAINGTSYDTRDAAAYVVVTGIGNAPRTFSYGGWEPPNWNLTSPEGESFDDIIDGFTLEVEDTESNNTASLS